MLVTNKALAAEYLKIKFWCLFKPFRAPTLHYDHAKIAVCSIFVNTVYGSFGGDKLQTLTLCRMHIWVLQASHCQFVD